jgi:uncharacterized sulfatase
MKRLPFILVLILLVVISFFFFLKEESDQKSAPKPNIIFILTDDLGYGDIGVLYQNNRKEEGKAFHQTPHLDQMATDGMLLTRHYVPAAVCAPSRASLLRGVHQGNAEIRNNQFDKALPDNHTLASVLKEAGYATSIIGKYGLQGKDGDSPATWDAYPTKRGFDYFFGYVQHRAGHNHYPAHDVRERPAVPLYVGDQEISSRLRGCYTTDLFTAVAKKWIVDHKNSNPDKPFFMYLAYDTPHAGLEVASSPYPDGGGLNGGVQWIGEEGNFINTVTDTIDNYIFPEYRNPAWPESQQRFASMVRRIDNSVGDLFQLLEDLGIEDNTLVIFTSDNGPHKESYGYGDYDPTMFESFGELDGIKRDTWEGGIRVPAIVKWPVKIAAGTRDKTPAQFQDWLPTFAAIAGLPSPANTDGVSLLPLLTGDGERAPGKVYIEYSVFGQTPLYPSFHESHKGQSRAEMQVIYLDGYKGVRYNIQSAEDDFLIYDTELDPGETNNLAGTSDYFIDLQKEMKTRVLQWRHPSNEAVRPYDSIPVPAVIVEEELTTGMKFKQYDTRVPWTPDISTLDSKPVKEGILEDFSGIKKMDSENLVVSLEAFIDIPETGEYQFTLKTNGNLVIRLHDALLFDADKSYEPNSVITQKRFLEKGLHPFKLVYRKLSDPEAVISIGMNGTGMEKEMIEPGRFRCLQEGK